VKDDQDKPEPKQFTPKGVEIPVPGREDFMRDLKTRLVERRL